MTTQAIEHVDSIGQFEFEPECCYYEHSSVQPAKFFVSAHAGENCHDGLMCAPCLSAFGALFRAVCALQGCVYCTECAKDFNKFTDFVTVTPL